MMTCNGSFAAAYCFSRFTSAEFTIFTTRRLKQSTSCQYRNTEAGNFRYPTQRSRKDPLLSESLGSKARSSRNIIRHWDGDSFPLG